MDATGKMTGTLAWPPPAPAVFPIVATPGLSMFPPFADEDSATTLKGVPVIINVVANDIAPFGTIDPASVRIATVPPGIFATLPSGATVQVNPDGTITYTPAATFSGADSFTYTVANNFGSVSLPGTVNVLVQAKPTAVNDTLSVAAKSTTVITIVANDIAGTSPINKALTQILTPPGIGCGSVINNFDGDVTYIAPLTIPVPATCSFTYLLGDTNVPPLLSNVATVTITITPPVAPVALNDTANTTTGTAVVIPVLANDTIAAPGVINPASIAVTAPTGAVAPNTNSGSAAANPDGTVTYTAPAIAGTYVFTYTVQDSVVPTTSSNAATVIVTVTQGHTPPVANNDVATVAVNGTVTIAILGNDTVTAPATLNPTTLTVSAPTGGSATVNPNGTINYTAPAVVGNYTFTYTVQDTFVPPAQSNTATVTVTVTPPGVIPPVTGLTLFSNVPSPQLSGTVISFDAAASGGSGNYEYEFLLRDQNGVYSLVQSYSPASVWNWNTAGLPSSPNYAIAVHARSVGSILGFEQERVMNFTLNAPSAPGVTVIATPNLITPQVQGSQVFFTAAVTGGTGTYEYQFWLKPAAGTVAAYVNVQPYSLNPTWKWDTSLVPPGAYTLAVQARVLGSPNIFDAETTIGYVINPLPIPATGVSISTNLISPQTAGTQVFVTGTASGGSGVYEYQFWLKDTTGVFTLMQPFSASPIWHWDTTGLLPGTYTLDVQARVPGTTATGFNVETTAPFDIQ
jgi:hypothetical protein